MREIKFRAWDSEINTMLYDNNGYLTRPSGTRFQISSNGNCSVVYLQESVILKPILMQYTGLKDKNGKEIYEGDIVSSGLGEIFYHTKKAKFQVRWHDKVFKRIRSNNQNYNSGEDLFMNCKIAWEVIGNIYENPELINQQQN